MKKSSKVPTRREETIGIDLGDKVSRYCVVDQDGEVIEEGTFRNQASSLEKHFGDRPRRIALQAGAQPAVRSRLGLDQFHGLHRLLTPWRIRECCYEPDETGLC